MGQSKGRVPFGGGKSGSAWKTNGCFMAKKRQTIEYYTADPNRSTFSTTWTVLLSVVYSCCLGASFLLAYLTLVSDDRRWSVAVYTIFSFYWIFGLALVWSLSILTDKHVRPRMLDVRLFTLSVALGVTVLAFVLGLLRL